MGVVALRTATHAFQLDEGSRFARYDWRSTATGFEGGFGRAILGETWIAHHGDRTRQRRDQIARARHRDQRSVGQSLDELLREFRLTPMVQLGVSYAF